MEQLRNKTLDNLCESIAEHRSVMNAARTDEQNDLTAALQEMQKKDVYRFTHAGIELVRVPGAERIRARLVKEQGDENDDDITEDAEGEFDGERAEAVAAD